MRRQQVSNVRHVPMKCLLKMPSQNQKFEEGVVLHSCVECNKEAFGKNVLHVCSGEAVVPEAEWVKKYKAFGI